MMMKSLARELRDVAEECSSIAAEIGDRPAQMQMVATAKVLRRLADEDENTDCSRNPIFRSQKATTDT